MLDLLLLHGTVITMDATRRIIKDGAVGVTGNRIVFIGGSAQAAHFEAKKTVDCTDHAILPGFIDSHSHGGHGLIRGSLLNNTSDWMAAITHIYNHYTSDDYWYHEGRLSALDKLRSGVTTAVCFIGAQTRCDDPIFAINHAKGYAEVGVREVVCTGPCHPPYPHKFSRWEGEKRTLRDVSYDDMIAALEQVIATLNHANDDRTRAFVAPYGLLPSVSPSFPTPADKLPGELSPADRHHLDELWRVANEYDTRIHTECYGGSIHTMLKAPNPLLGPRVHLEHCAGCSFDEILALKDTGTNIGVTFQSTTPVLPMLHMGMKVAIGSDGPKILGNADMFQCMRMTQNRHKDDSSFSGNDMWNLPPHKLLEMTTIDAAQVIGWDNDIGSLEEGKKADIIAVNLMNSRMTPRANLVDSLVMLGCSGDVDHVVVDGRVLLENGDLCLSDERQLLLDAEREAQATFARAGLQAFMDAPHQWGAVRRYPELRFDLEWQRQDGGYY